MALIECPECHKEVSDKADACPHCGNPIAATKNEKPKDKSRRGCLVFILLLIGVAVLLSIIGGHEKTGEHEDTPRFKPAVIFMVILRSIWYSFTGHLSLQKESECIEVCEPGEKGEKPIMEDRKQTPEERKTEQATKPVFRI